MASSAVVEDGEYKCTLDAAALEKAKKELGEDPETRLLEVKQLRKRLEKVPGLKPRTDISFLLPFLRARKFDQEKTFNMVKHQYQEKQDNNSHYDDLKPSKLKHIMDIGIVEVLKHRDANGSRVIVVRPGLWEPDRCPIEDIIKLIYVTLSKLCEEEETQVHGIHVIDQLDSLSWKQAVHVTPGLAKLLASTLQEMLPLRLKTYDFLNEPTFFDVVFPILKSFMKEKLVQRIKLNGPKVEALQALLPPDHLPIDLGGTLELFSYNQEFMSRLLASEKDFEYNNKFGFLSMDLENEKKESSKQDAQLQGLGGTFKKLNV